MLFTYQRFISFNAGFAAVASGEAHYDQEGGVGDVEIYADVGADGGDLGLDFLGWIVDQVGVGGAPNEPDTLGAGGVGQVGDVGEALIARPALPQRWPGASPQGAADFIGIKLEAVVAAGVGDVQHRLDSGQDGLDQIGLGLNDYFGGF